MNQRRQVIVAVVAVGLVSAALMVWHESADNVDTASAPPAQTPATAFAPSSTPVAASDSTAHAPAAPTPPPAAEATSAAPEATPPVASAPVDVDTPEPAEQKFARGAQSPPGQN